ITNINAEPVLLMSENSRAIEDVFAKYLNIRPEYDFTTTDTVHHQLWVVEEETDIKKISDAYAQINAFYIADGHHRSSSSARLFEKRKTPTSTGEEPWNYCLA